MEFWKPHPQYYLPKTRVSGIINVFSSNLGFKFHWTTSHIYFLIICTLGIHVLKVSCITKVKLLF